MNNAGPIVVPTGLEFADNGGSVFLRGGAQAGALQLVDALGRPVGSVSVSGDAKDMFKARAQAFLPPGFHTQWIDFYGAPTDDVTSGFAPTAAQVNVSTGRCGGQKTRLTTSGATGFHYEAGAIQSIGGGAVAICVGNVVYDPWYTETCVVVNAITGSGELGLCGLTNSLFGFGNLDSTSGQYLMLSIRLALSATNLVVVSNQGGGVIATTVTTIPIELATQRIYSLASDGAGTVYTYRDGVLFDKIPMPPNQPATTNGALARYERANGGTTDITLDYYASAGVSP